MDLLPVPLLLTCRATTPSVWGRSIIYLQTVWSLAHCDTLKTGQREECWGMGAEIALCLCVCPSWLADTFVLPRWCLRLIKVSKMEKKFPAKTATQIHHRVPNNISAYTKPKGITLQIFHTTQRWGSYVCPIKSNSTWNKNSNSGAITLPLLNEVVFNLWPVSLTLCFALKAVSLIELMC